jgi:hypothetical protein
MEYARVIGEWEAAGHRLPASPAAKDLTVSELILAYWKHAEQHYRRPDGTQTKELSDIRAKGRPCSASGQSPCERLVSKQLHFCLTLRDTSKKGGRLGQRRGPDAVCLIPLLHLAPCRVISNSVRFQDAVAFSKGSAAISTCRDLTDRSPRPRVGQRNNCPGHSFGRPGIRPRHRDPCRITYLNERGGKRSHLLNRGESTCVS